MFVPPSLRLHHVGRGPLTLAVLFCSCGRIGNGFFLVPRIQAGIRHQAVYAGRCAKNKVCTGVLESGARGRRNLRTRLRESVRGNRDKIEIARSKLRDAMVSLLCSSELDSSMSLGEMVRARIGGDLSVRDLLPTSTSTKRVQQSRAEY